MFGRNQKFARMSNEELLAYRGWSKSFIWELEYRIEVNEEELRWNMFEEVVEMVEEETARLQAKLDRLLVKRS